MRPMRSCLAVSARLCCATLVFGLGAGCASYPQRPMVVRVRDADTLLPVVGAAVQVQVHDPRKLPINPVTFSGAADYVLRPSDASAHRARTGSDGTVVLPARHGRPCSVFILMPGYWPAAFLFDDHPLDVAPPGWLRDDLGTGPDPGRSHLEVQFDPAESRPAMLPRSGP